MSTKIPGEVPMEYFVLAVEKTLRNFIESDKNVHKFPKCFDCARIKIICKVAEDKKLQWKLCNDELIIVKDLDALPNNKFELRTNSLSVVVKMVELMNSENNKENNSPASPRSPTDTESRGSQSRTPHKENCVLSVPPKSANLHKFDESKLAIHKHRDNFLNVFNNCRIVVVEGSAGSGKTTQIPQFLLNHYSELNLDCRILVVNPSRICAVIAAERVSEQLNETVGVTVGYQIKLESRASPASNLIYTSADCILTRLLHEQPNDYFQNVSILIIDEVQERDILTDLLMLCVRDLVDTKDLKVVIISSNNSAEIATYFDDCVPGVFKIPYDERAEPCVIYLEDVLKKENVHFTKDQLNNMQTSLLKSSYSSDDSKKSITYDQILLETYNQQRGNVVDLDLIANFVEHLYYSTKMSSTILIFLPGYNEILLLGNKLFNVLDPTCEIIPIHNQMQSTDQSKIFEKFPQTVRKIILTTSLAESMLTIDDVEYVIDTGKERFETFDAKNSISSSCVNWISKRSAIQRGTRVTIPNRSTIYRLYSKDCFESFVDENEPPILYSDITKICLMSKLSIHYHIKLLQQIGALYPDESITPLGNLLVEIPLPIQYAKMLIYGIFFRCIDPMLTITSILTVGSPFTIDGVNENSVKVVDIKKKLHQESFSDIFVMLRAFQKWNEYKTSQIYDVSFCEQYSVGSGTLEMINLNRIRLVGHLRAMRMVQSVGNIASLNERSNNWSVIKACIAGGCYPSIANIHGEIKTVKDENVDFHPETALLTANFNTSVINWIVFDKKTQDAVSEMLIENCTIVSDFCLALVAGHAIDLRIETTSADAHSIRYNIRVDDFIQFTGSEVTAKALKFLRDQLNQVFDKFLLDVGKFQLNDANDFTVHDGIVLLLKLEDDALGLKTDYEGIGSRPRIVTREFDTTVSSYANSTMNSMNTSSSSIASVLSKLRL